MVKGTSRQVIVLHSPETKLFDEAIFILKENALREKGVTDDVLLKEAKRLLSGPRKQKWQQYRGVWAAIGAATTGLAWLLTVLL